MDLLVLIGFIDMHAVMSFGQGSLLAGVPLQLPRSTDYG
jgi:hypothetical protein